MQQAKLNELNQRYQRNGEGIFYFFHRHRQWNEAQESWMGWERKRGALVEFTSLLRGNDNTHFSTQVGDLSILPKVKYVITLMLIPIFQEMQPSVSLVPLLIL